MIKNVARPDAAIENLTNHQQQADTDRMRLTHTLMPPAQP